MKKLHEKIDGKESVLVILKSTRNKICGGYASSAFNSSGIWIKDEKSFLFSLTNRTKHLIKKEKS